MCGGDQYIDAVGPINQILTATERASPSNIITAGTDWRRAHFVKTYAVRRVITGSGKGE